MKLTEIAGQTEKAGFIPFIMKDGIPIFFFMTPSKKEFGGILPQIAKGGIDDGETVYEAALREAKEELGLRKSNLINDSIFLAWRGKIKTKSEIYTLSVYAGEVKKASNFKEPHYETGSTHWLSQKEFSKVGRKIQRPIVAAVHNFILQRKGTHVD